LLSRKLQEYELQPEDIYNMDEKGFMIGMLVKGLRIFSEQKYNSGGLKQRLQDGNREWITSIACICADGTSLSPGLIYQATSGNIQDSWLQDFDPKLHACFFASSPSGWTNDELGYAWLTNIFDRETKEKARRRWRLLILDGHGSHFTMKFIDYCDANRILLMTYPPHSTHSLPLDVGIFSPLSTAYSKHLEEFLHKFMGISGTSSASSGRPGNKPCHRKISFLHGELLGYRHWIPRLFWYDSTRRRTPGHPQATPLTQLYKQKTGERLRGS
jgi:hypothetical protein